MSSHFRVAALAAGLLAASPAAATAHGYTVGDLKIGHPWSSPVPPGVPTAAGYLTLTNTGTTPDRLIGGSTPDAAGIEIHQMSMTGGIMRMRRIEGGLVVPPGQTVRLEPGGYDLMLVGPKRAFKDGDHILATLRLAREGEVKVDFHVQAEPGSGEHAHKDKP